MQRRPLVLLVVVLLVTPFSVLFLIIMVVATCFDLPMTVCAVQAAVRVNLGVVSNAAADDDDSKCHALLELMDLAKKHRSRMGGQNLSAASLFEQAGGFRVLVNVLADPSSSRCSPRLAGAIMDALGLFLLFDDSNDTNKKAFRSAGGIDVILSTMRDYDDSVSPHAVVVMHVLTKDNEIMDELITSKEAISAVVSAMKSLPNDVKTQYKGCLFLKAVASHVSVEFPGTLEKNKAQAIEVVVTALLNHRNDDRVRPSAICAIHDLTKNISGGDTQERFASDGLAAIVSILKQSPTKFHHTNACRIVEHLATNGCMDTVIQSGCIPLLLSGLKQRRNDETTLDAATRTLLVLASKSEDAKKVMVDADGIHLLSSISRSGSIKDSIRTVAREIHDLCSATTTTTMSENFPATRKHATTDILRQRNPLVSVEQHSVKDVPAFTII